MRRDQPELGTQEAETQEPRKRPDKDFHDGDEDEYVELPEASVTLEANGVIVTARATGETAVRDVHSLVDKAVDAIDKLRIQIQ